LEIAAVRRGKRWLLAVKVATIAFIPHAARMCALGIPPDRETLTLP
jgi:hypothetical protein